MFTIRMGWNSIVQVFWLQVYGGTVGSEYFFSTWVIAEIPRPTHVKHARALIYGRKYEEMCCLKIVWEQIAQKYYYGGGSQHRVERLFSFTKAWWWYCVPFDTVFVVTKSGIYWAHVGKCAKVRHYSSPHVKKRWVMILCVLPFEFFVKIFSL